LAYIVKLWFWKNKQQGLPRTNEKLVMSNDTEFSSIEYNWCFCCSSLTAFRHCWEADVPESGCWWYDLCSSVMLNLRWSTHKWKLFNKKVHYLTFSWLMWLDNNLRKFNYLENRSCYPWIKFSKENNKQIKKYTTCFFFFWSFFCPCFHLMLKKNTSSLCGDFDKVIHLYIFFL